MRLVLGLCLAFGLSLVLAGPASAGAFGSPVNFDACGTIDVAGGAMSNPTTAFTSAGSVKQCQQLCKQGGNVCKQSVRDSASCYLRLLRSYKNFGNKNCDVIYDNAQDRRMCKQDWNNTIKDENSGVKSARQSSIDDCGEWTDICQASCSAP